MSAMRASTSASQACGSTPLSFAQRWTFDFGPLGVVEFTLTIGAKLMFTPGSDLPRIMCDDA